MSGDELDRTKNIRAGHRAAVTRTEREILATISADDASKEKITRLKVLQKTLEEKLVVLKSLDEKLLGLVDAAEIENDIATASEIEIKVQENIAKCQQFLDDQIELGSLFSSRRSSIRSQGHESRRSQINHGLQNQGTTSQDLGANTPPVSEHGGSHNSQRNSWSKVKLPKLELPKFNGEITKFFSFWDSFESMIGTNEDLSSIDKFNYLQRSLRGEAQTALEGLPIRDRTYDAAVEMLKERFGNTQKIISMHMDKLVKLKSCESENIVALRSIYDQINIQVRGLEALGINHEKYGCLLVPIVMAILPNQISLQIARNTTTDVWTLDGLMNIFKREVEARELNAQVSVSDKEKTKTSYQSTKRIVGTSSTLHSKDEGPSRLPTCAFCDKRHYSAECRNVPNINDRREKLQKTGRCFVCLNTGHMAKDCSGNRKCRNCKRRHHHSICQGENGESGPKQEKPEETVTATSHSNRTGSILLQTARTFAFRDNQDEKVPIRILFDSGSQRSYITDELRDKLGLKVEGKEILNLNTFGSNKYRKQSCTRVKVKVETSDRQFIEITALSHPVICSPIKSPVNVNSYAHLLGLELADNLEDVENDHENIDILIGANFYHEFVLGETIRGSSGPVAVSSKLGWLVSGPSGSVIDGSVDTYVVSNIVVESINDSTDISSESDELTASFKQVFEVESQESPEDIDSEKSKFIETCNIRKAGDRYETGLPWKPDLDEPLSDNRTLCLNRLKSLHYRLKKDPELFNSYNGIFQEQLKAGIIERVPKEKENKGNVHFMPHHGVVRKDRQTSKLRIVFDGSARSAPHSLSLNDHLEIGPNFVPQLFDLLIDFRSHSIALTADIEKAFLQISIQETDRDYLRFYWFDDIKADNPTVTQFRYCRLPFGLTSSAAVLGATLHAHVNQYQDKYPEAMKVLNRFYVDDLTGGCHDVQGGLDIYRAAKDITNSAGFNLRKWKSNSKELVQHIEQLESNVESNVAMDSLSAHTNVTGDSISGENNVSREFLTGEDNQSYAKATTGSPAQDDKTKVLGIHWNIETDEIFFDTIETVEYAKTLPVTKRSLLKYTAKIFDPLGVLCPFVIKLKALFQEMCVEKVDWDEELQGDFRLKYFNSISELQELQRISLPRCYFKEKKIVSVQLHGFSDASERAFASVIYIRVEYEDGEIDVKFVSSKARVSPIKPQSIPRLELMGALLVAKHMESVKNALNIEGYEGDVVTNFWVDSSTVLCWVRNSKPWKQFVRHRVQQILSISSRDQWRFCPGTLNPADIPSRGIRGSALSHNGVWWQGPNFLSFPPSEWPGEIFTGDGKYDEAFKEIVQNPPTLTFALSAKEKGDGKLSDILDINRFSSRGKLLRVLGYMFRFIDNIRSKKQRKDISLAASELDTAENFVIGKIQSEHFGKELAFLADTRTQSDRKPPLLVSQFNLLVDEHGILRARSRIKNANVESGCKEPILLPSRHYYSDLVIQEFHMKVFHNGVRDTLNAIRQRYWVLRGRESVKKLVRRCVICRKLEGIFFKPVSGHDLPDSRVDDGPPFINTGVDFAGPLFISDRNNANKKVYICLFTCASTRAVHLELVDKLDVTSFLRALRRFTARRGLPRTFLSDNAKTFKSAAKEVKKIILSAEVQSYLADRSVSWRFIVQKAAWNGGIWERLVRSVKRCLRKVIGRAALNYEELVTLLVEIESIINSRPITYVYDDTEGVSYPLTPAELLYGRSTTRTSNGRHFEIISTNETLTKRANYHRKLLQNFTKRWKNEYLLAIREALSSTITSEKPNIEVGDVVVLKDDQTKRQFWKLARIEELIIGRDGNIRAAKVRVPNDKGTSLLIRHLKHLVPLEVPSRNRVANPIEVQPETEEPLKVQETVVDNSKGNVRPRRNAAVIGELRRKDNL